MAVTNKAIAAAKRNISDYKREYDRVQRAIEGLQREFGPNYKFRLKVPLKDPSAVTAREARRGIKRIQNILRRRDDNHTALSKFVEAVVEPNLLTAGGAVIPGKTMQALKAAIDDMNDINYYSAIKSAAYGKEIGWKMKPVTRKDNHVSVATEKAANKLLNSLQKRISFYDTHPIGFLSRGSMNAFEERMLDTISYYPKELQEFMIAEWNRRSRQELARRFAAYYQRDFAGDKKASTEWSKMWYQSMIGDYSNAADFLIVMGLDVKRAQEVEDLYYNNKFKELDELYLKIYGGK